MLSVVVNTTGFSSHGKVAILVCLLLAFPGLAEAKGEGEGCSSRQKGGL